MVRAWLLMLACTGCVVEADELVPELKESGDRPTRAGAPDVLGTPAPGGWRFAVLSDLHLPNPHEDAVEQMVAALIDLDVRLVVITGDHTNGSEHDRRRSRADAWWDAVTDALKPLRDAGIAVLPVAGNHDTYTKWQRDAYATAFSDLEEWAAPFKVNAHRGRGLAQPPFAYSVDIDGVHLTLAHVVDQGLDRDVATWITEDLEAAKGARHRLVFGHVPLVSVIAKPSKSFFNQLAPILERGKVDFYVAGHEHVTWDESFALPRGGEFRQVTVGCSSGYYNFQPSAKARARANCAAVPNKRGVQRCTMPNGGEFELGRGRHGRHVQHELLTFVVFTLEGESLDATPMSIDKDGRPRAFYLD